MNSCGTEKPVEVEEGTADAKLPILCLLPEWPALDGTESDQRQKYLKDVHGLYTRFACRCERSMVLTTENGLVDFEDDYVRSRKRFEDLRTTEIHDWIIKTKQQLVPLLRPGLAVVCLAGGNLLKSMRRMELNVIAPLTGMSERQRRRWLEARLGETNFGIGFNLTGGLGSAAAV